MYCFLLYIYFIKYSNILFSDGKGASGGLVFGIPLMQCVQNDRLARATGDSPFRSNAELTGCGDEPSNMNRHGSRSSFSSLIDSTRNDEVCVICFIRFYF